MLCREVAEKKSIKLPRKVLGRASLFAPIRTRPRTRAATDGAFFRPAGNDEYTQSVSRQINQQQNMVVSQSSSSKIHPISPELRKRRLCAVASAAVVISTATTWLKSEVQGRIRRGSKAVHVPSHYECSDYFGECVSDDYAAIDHGMMYSKEPWKSVMNPKRCASYGPLFGPNSTYTFVEDESHPNGKCPWVQEGGDKSACQYFCYYDESFGVARINHELWQAAQNGEAAIWVDSVAADDRSEEIVEGFGGYQSVADNVPLGKLLEVGSGPYTQTKALIDTLRRKLKVDPGIEAISLVDPGIDGYVKSTKYCSYRNHTLNGYPVTNLQSVGGEQMVFEEPESYDAVLSINVIEHCENAFEYLRRMDGALKPGGLLIFHDRVYDQFWKTIDPVRDAKEVAGLHPLRVKRRLFDRMIEGRYDIIMLSTNLTDAMEVRKANQITEEPIWLVARKKKR